MFGITLSLTEFFENFGDILLREENYEKTEIFGEIFLYF